MTKLDSKMKNFGKLFFGNSTGQIIAFCLYPYIANFYTPEAFSLFGFMTSVTVLLSVFATGQLHTAALNPTDNSEAENLIGISCSLVLISSILSFLYFILFRPSLCLISIYLFLYSIFEIQKMALLRKKLFNQSVSVQLGFRMAGNGLKLVPYLVGYQAIGLILSEITSLFMILIYGFKKSFFHFSFNFNVLKKYINFPLFQTFTIAINLIILDFPILFWKGHFKELEIGYFVMGQKLIVLPALIISNAFQSATVHDLLGHKKPIHFFIKNVILFVFLGAVATILFHMFGTDILVKLLGRNWANGSEIFELLSYALVVKLVYATAQSVFVLKGMTKAPLMIRSLQFVIMLSIISFDFNFYESIKLYIIIDIIFDFILLTLAGFNIRPPFIFRETL